MLGTTETVKRLLFVLDKIETANVKGQKNTNNNKRVHRIRHIPLDGLLYVVRTLTLLCHVLQHSQDHVPREGRYPQAIPSEE